MRLFTFFVFAVLSLSSAQSQNVNRLNNSSGVENGTNEELSLAKYQSNQKSDQLDLTENVPSNGQLQPIKCDLDTEIGLHNQTKYQLEQAKSELIEAHKQREDDKTNAERCVNQVAAQTVYNNTVKPNWFQRGYRYFRDKADFRWVVQGVDAILNGSTRKLFSEEFELRGYQFRAQAKLAWCKGRVTCFGLSFKDEDGRKGPMDLTVFPKIYWLIKDQSSNSKRKDRFYRYNSFFKSDQMNYDTFYRFKVQSNLTDVINTTLYTANDTMVMDFHVEPLEVAELVYSYNGTLTWAVENYREEKHLASQKLSGCSLNPYFYTSSKGFRVQTCAYLNGRGNYTNKGLSIRFYVVNGRFDKYLKKFVSHQVTVTVFHPIEEDRKFIKQVNIDELQFIIDVGSHEEIEKLVYEGTLYYKVTVIANKLDR